MQTDTKKPIYSRICGTGGYLPSRVMTNAEIATFLATSDEWITERTGIKQRHIANDDETAATMATAAARHALAAAGISPAELGFIIVATCTPDYVFPSTACLVQAALQAGNGPAFDVSAACAGFSYALTVADHFIKQGIARYGLVIGSELMSRVIDWQDRSTCILFGDGAGAVVLSAADEPGILSTHLHADGKQSDILYVPNPRIQQSNLPIFTASPTPTAPFMTMQGNDVFKYAVTALSAVIQETLDANQLVGKAIDWFIPHQANQRIITSLAKKMKIPLSRVVMTIAEQANTSTASIPLALDTAVRDGRIQRGHTLLLESFGGGIVWGSALIKY